MKEKLIEKIKKSGNNLHLNVVSFLEKKGWEVDLSPYYCDERTDKPREIDIIANKPIRIFDESDKYLLHICLFIECKHFKSESAFRVIPNDRDFAKDSIIIEGIDTPRSLKETRLKDKHHYCTANVIAKLYDSEDKNDDKKIFEAVTQPLKSFVFFQNRLPPKAICYPMVVYSGIPGFYLIEGNNIDQKYLKKLKTTKEFLFGVKYSYKKPVSAPVPLYDSRCFIVDFVHQDGLGAFLDNIENVEISELCTNLRTEIKKDLN